jgi:predicted Na+-dependent transporter
MSKWIRQFHRWTSIVFVATIIITSIALAQAEPVVWVSYIPLLPLFLLLASGLYMFVLPYVQRWRAGRAGA